VKKLAKVPSCPLLIKVLIQYRIMFGLKIESMYGEILV
jgi:hypothetical protein